LAGNGTFTVGITIIIVRLYGSPESRGVQNVPRGLYERENVNRYILHGKHRYKRFVKRSSTWQGDRYEITNKCVEEVSGFINAF
jgi:hypothetical protein